MKLLPKAMGAEDKAKTMLSVSGNRPAKLLPETMGTVAETKTNRYFERS